MVPSLNLSPARGPSAWDRMERQSTRDRLATGLFALGFGCIAAGVLMRPRPWTLSARFTRRRATDDAVDRASADSFPASDPPSIPAVESKH